MFPYIYFFQGYLQDQLIQLAPGSELILLFTSGQTLLDLLKSETTQRFDREEMRVHAHLCTGSLKDQKKKKKGAFLRVINFCLCPGL